jgi:hypothetical protein
MATAKGLAVAVKDDFLQMKALKLDFTLEKYRQLCSALLASGYSVCTVVQYLGRTGLTGKTAVLRHDVDRKPGNALKMAMLEQSLGIKSTYYFRMNKSVFKRDMIKTIAGMGHEIGYRYEALDKARGNYEKAINVFEQELAELRKVAEVKTICMHGNPLTKWDNRDLWARYDFKSFGLLGEAYISFSDILYLSDTGRTWNPKRKVKDWLPSERGSNVNQAISGTITCTDDLIQLIREAQQQNIYLVAHPERWTDSPIEWALYFAQDLMINLLKSIKLFVESKVREA